MYVKLGLTIPIMKKEIELYEIIYLVNPSFTQQEISSKIDYYQIYSYLLGK